MLDTPLLRLYLFGSLRLERNGRAIHLPTRKVEALLAYLVLHPEPPAREKLAALFWGDVLDARARRSLRVALTTIRKQLGENLLFSDRESVQINRAYPCWVDALEFDKILEGRSPNADRDTHDSSAMLDLQSAIDLYRGDLLSEFYDDWIVPAREHYRLRYLDALLQLTRQLRARGEYERAIAFAQQVLASDNTHERAHQNLMFCYLATGNRSAALKQYEECERILRDELAVAPTAETKALFEWIRQAPSQPQAHDALPTNLPIPLTSFIGRAQEMSAIKQFISKTRLLTLTGTGGSGKTRLAIQVATDLLDVFKDGVWWVDLAALSNPLLVPKAVATALGIREVPNTPLVETLAQQLHARHLLLVLDNCEHLVGACAPLAETLLRGSAPLKILATSRELFRITGEMAWPVPMLSLPDRQRLFSIKQLMEFEGMRLFVERASAINPAFALTEQNAPSVVSICQRLDGIPLAIELAAARIKLLSAEQIAARLDDRFNLLTAGSRTALPRHQTLRATLDWSYGLLAEAEQVLLRRLAVFAGGCTLEAAEAICKDEERTVHIGDSADVHPSSFRLHPSEVLEWLSHLIDKSLVVAEQQGAVTRCRMLETIREYALEKLRASGEEAMLRKAHRDGCMQLAERAESELIGPQQQEWLERLELEHNNMRAALQWSLAGHDAEAGLRLAAALFRFWYIHSQHNSEGRRWLERALEATRHNPTPSAARAKALRGLAGLALIQGDYPSARAVYDEALDLFQTLGDKTYTAITLSNIGNLALMQEDYAAARAFLEDSLDMHHELGNRFYVGYCLWSLAHVARAAGDYARSRAYSAEALEIFRTFGNKQYAAHALNALGHVAFLEGEYRAARAYVAEALLLLQEVADQAGICEGLDAFAAIEAALETPERAARLLGAAEALREAIGIHARIFRAIYEYAIAAVRAALSAAEMAQTWAEGRAMTVEQAVAYAIQAEESRRVVT